MKRLLLCALAVALFPSLAGAVPQGGPPSILPLSMGGVGNNSGDLSALTATATGATTARKLSARAIQLMSPADFKQSSDADDTLSFQRAITWALSQSAATQITVPCGKYTISGSLGATVSGTNLSIVGQSAGCVQITQTADADAFAYNVAATGGNMTQSGVELRNLSVAMSPSVASSTTRKAFAVIGAEASGQVGVPVILSNLNYQSASATAYWGYGVYAYDIADNIYIDHINGSTPLGSTVNLYLGSGSPNYITGASVRDVWSNGGSVGLQIGDWWQGLHFSNLNMGNAPAGLVIGAAGYTGLNVELQIDSSYIMGTVTINAPSTASLSHIIIRDSVFDGSALGNNSTVMTIGTTGGSGIAGLDLRGNRIIGNPSATGTTGLVLLGSIATGVVANNTFGSFLNAGSVAIKPQNTTYAVMFIGNSLMNNTTSIADTAVVNNVYMANNVNNVVYASGDGTAKDALVVSTFGNGGNIAYFGLTGPDAAISYLFSTKGMPGTDYRFRDGNQNEILDLIDAGSGTTNCGFTMTGALAGSAPKLGSTCSGFVAVSAPPILPSYTVSALPSCASASAGAIAYVTDAASPTYNGTLTGGGSTKTLALCNGSSWTAH